MFIWGNIVIKALEFISYLVGKWAQDEKTKKEWAAAVEEARIKYRASTAEPNQIKKDYDELKDDLRQGKWKV